MEYAKTVPFAGNAAKALNAAQTAFIGEGFRIVASRDDELRVNGPGLNGTKENSLKGVGEASIIIRNSAIEMKANLNGTAKLKKFLRFFPLVLMLLFSLVGGIVFVIIALTSSEKPPWWVFLIIVAAPALALSPWLLLSPMMTRWIENRTVRALDTLLDNMAMIAKDD